MRNHGLTTRKVGLFIPRYLSDLVGFKLDNTTGKDSTGWLPKRQIHLFQPPRATMEWPSHAYATSLFPSLENDESSIIPTFPNNEPVDTTIR